MLLGLQVAATWEEWLQLLLVLPSLVKGSLLFRGSEAARKIKQYLFSNSHQECPVTCVLTETVQ